MASVEAVWSQLLPGSVSAAVTQRWWEVIHRHYSEPQRHYHTLNHIDHMMALADEYAYCLQDHIAVKLAIIFHE